MDPSSRWRRALALAVEPVPVGPEEAVRVARNVRAGIVAALVGCGLAILTDVIAGSWRSMAILAGFVVLDLGLWGLLRRGRVLAAATGLLLGIIATVHALP